MLVLSLFAVLALSPIQDRPVFTDEDVRRAVQCADQSNDRCARSEDIAATITCLALPQHAGEDAVSECLSNITDRCVMRWQSTTPEMNRRAILICAAQSRAAMREGANDWLGRAETSIDASAFAQYRSLTATVPERAEQDAESVGSDAVRQAGARTGVWASFILFLWHEQWQYPGWAGTI